jgi:hypothetical protein
MHGLQPYKCSPWEVQLRCGGPTARWQWQIPAGTHRAGSLPSAESDALQPGGGPRSDSQVPHMLLECWPTQGGEQVHAFFTGCPLVVPCHDFELVAEHGQRCRPVKPGWHYSICATSCAPATSMLIFGFDFC